MIDWNSFRLERTDPKYDHCQGCGLPNCVFSHSRICIPAIRASGTVPLSGFRPVLRQKKELHQIHRATINELVVLQQPLA